MTATKKRGGGKKGYKGKKKNAKKNNYSRSSSTVVRAPSNGGISDRLYTMMTYSMTKVLTSTVTPAYNIFRLNSIHDPDATGTGKRPLTHNQWQSFYKNYRVYGAKFHVDFINTSTTEQVDVFVVPKSVTDVTTVSDLLMEKGLVKKSLLGIEGSGQAIRAIKGYYSNAKILGYTKKQYGTEKATSATMTSNAAEQTYLHVYSQCIDQATSVSVRIRVNITYYVCLFDRVQLSQST